MIPEISVTVLNEKLESQERFILLDVRELEELKLAQIMDSRLAFVPLSRLAQEGISALPESMRSQEMPVYVLCHHGNRSMQTAMWLAQQGYENVFNVSGGIDEYARKIDRSVGMY